MQSQESISDGTEGSRLRGERGRGSDEGARVPPPAARSAESPSGSTSPGPPGTSANAPYQTFAR